MTDRTTSVPTPRDVAEQVHRMVEGRDGIVFADLFAADGVLEYPFAPPGMPSRLEGRDAIREYHANLSSVRELLAREHVSSTIHETTDREVVVVEIDHAGTSRVTNRPYRVLAVGVIRVRDGEIVEYRDYMNPLALAELVDGEQRA